MEQYEYVNALVLFYQMETRWHIRQLLIQVICKIIIFLEMSQLFFLLIIIVHLIVFRCIKYIIFIHIQVFGIMCALDREVVKVLGGSVLPRELARDMLDNPKDNHRLAASSRMLVAILSMADPLPITHFG